MSDLSLEQCRNLARRGLPQGLRLGDKYWGKGSLGNHVYLDEYRPPIYYYKIPDLEELMEFARMRCSANWGLHPGMKYMVIGGLGDYEDEDPKQAVYQMIEYYFEEVKETVYICPGPHDWFALGGDDKEEYFGCRRPKCMASKVENVKA